MLEYRKFPGKTAAHFLLYSPFLAYCFFSISRLFNGDLFENPGIDYMLLLGLGMGMAALAILPVGQVLDRTKKGLHLLAISALVPMVISIIFKLQAYPVDQSPTLETVFVLALFSGLVSTLVSWGVTLNQMVVVKFRGRIVAAFLSTGLILYILIVFINQIIPFYSLPLPFLEFAVFGCLLASFGMKPWSWVLHPLAVKENVMRYFIPMVLLLASHITWYFSTKMALQEMYNLVGATYESLLSRSGLGTFQILIVAIGVIVAGIIADLRGRKTAFSTAVLAFGLLAIFGQTFYWISVTPQAAVEVLALPLLSWERFVEGYMLGLCLLLIWTELGSPNRKGLRLSLVIWFYIGYMALFWAADLGVPFGYPPQWVGDIGGPFAIFFSLIALWQMAHLPQIVGREIEMEDFALDFDKKEVDKTVSAFLEAEDFESIKTQLAVIDATEELSDSDFSEIVGDDLKQMLPLKRVKGIGPAFEQKLRRAGYDSAAQLAGETPKRLASKIEGLSEKQAERVLLNAREAVNQLAKTKK